MDFFTGLPMVQKNNMVFIVVDRLSKMIRLIPMPEKSTAQEVADAFLANVVKLHGLPQKIVSDRDVRFTSKFWKSLWSTLGTKLNLSTAYHPQTDG